MFFQHGKQSLDTSGFADEWDTALPVRRPYPLYRPRNRTPGQPLPPSGRGALGLQPVQQRRLCAVWLCYACLLNTSSLTPLQIITQYIIVLRPVNNGYISCRSPEQNSLTVLLSCGSSINSAILPVCRPSGWKPSSLGFSARIRIVQPDHLTRPWNSHLKQTLPEVVFGRLFDGPIFSIA